MPAGFRQIAHDYSNGDKRIIVAACDAEDTEGLVYATDDEGWAQLEAGVSADALQLKPAFTVESGSRRAARFTRASGEAARLIFAHMAGYEPRNFTRRERKNKSQAD